MQAIILVAGMGKRLKQYTANNTKCMVRVNGITEFISGRRFDFHHTEGCCWY